jgi:hypothetical protein
MLDGKVLVACDRDMLDAMGPDQSEQHVQRNAMLFET